MLTADVIYMLQHRFSPSVAAKVGLGTLLDRRARVSRLQVSYTDLKAGKVNLGDLIPSGAVIRRVYYKVATVFTDNGGNTSTLKLGIEDQSADCLAATAINNAAWNATATKDGIVVDTAATRLVLTADRQLAITLAYAGGATALTAGKAYVYVAWDPLPQT